MSKLIWILSLFLFGHLAHAQNCDLNHFRQKFCISNIPQHLGLDELNHLNCENLANHPEADFQLSQAFQIAPRSLQLRFCSVDRILVHPTFKEENAQSWSYPPESHIIGVDKAFIDAKTSLAYWSKSDISMAMFGKTLVAGESLPSQFGLDVNRPNIPGLAVMFTMAHEMGHILYRTRNLSLRHKLFGDCLEKNCPNFAPGTWGSLDWLDGISPTGKDDQVFRGTIQERNLAIRNFFLPPGTPPPVHVLELNHFFHSLYDSSFVTPFSLASPEEDFCETYGMLAVISIVRSWSFQYVSGPAEDVIAKMAGTQNPHLITKFRFVQYANSTLPY